MNRNDARRIILSGSRGTAQLPTSLPLSHDALSAIRRDGERLAIASESLLAQVVADSESPHVSAVSHIHHLAAAMLDRMGSVDFYGLAANGDSRPEDSSKCSLEAIRLADRMDPVEFSPVPVGRHSERPHATEISDAPESVELPPPFVALEVDVVRSPTVLVIDASPFIRLLLTSAIESCGHAVDCAATFDDAQAALRSENLALVAVGEIGCREESDRLRDWLKGIRHSNHIPVVELSDADEVACDLAATGEYQIRRTDIAGLLERIGTMLGDARHAVRQIA